MSPSNQLDTTTRALYPHQRPPTIRQWRNDVAEELELAGMDDMAERWLSCSENCFTKIKPTVNAKLPSTAETVYVCSSNHHHDAEIYSQTCDLRICPECARRHAARLVARYLPKCEELIHQHHRRFRFRHITFTSPFALESDDIKKKLEQGFKWVYNVMDSLMHAPKWRGVPYPVPSWRSDQGYLVTSEFGESGRKLHYHVIHYGEYLNQADLSAGWRKQTSGEAFVVDVRGFPYRGLSIEETLQEVLKYAVKFYGTSNATGAVVCIPAALMPVLARTLEKTRRIRSYGVFYNLPEQNRPDHSCEACGSPMVGIPVDYFVTFCNTGFLPLEWKAHVQPALNLKLADKSRSMSSGVPPPAVEIQSFSQKMMDWIKNIRRSDFDG